MAEGGEPTDATATYFDVFEQAREAAAGPVAFFHADVMPSPLKRPRPACSVLPLVRLFVGNHCVRMCTDLRSQDGLELAVAVEAAATCLRADPPDLHGCGSHATRVETSTWDSLQETGWPHVSWREAFVVAQLMLCCVDVDHGADEDALRRCDRAFILGGPNPAVVDCMALLEPYETPQIQNYPPVTPPIPLLEVMTLVKEIERRPMPMLRDELEEISRSRRPVVLEGGMRHWQAIKKWFVPCLIRKCTAKVERDLVEKS